MGSCTACMGVDRVLAGTPPLAVARHLAVASAAAAGVVALALADGNLGELPAAVTTAIGEELLAACDVTGLRLVR
jgi:hypothetical protein